MQRVACVPDEQWRVDVANVAAESSRYPIPAAKPYMQPIFVAQNKTASATFAYFIRQQYQWMLRVEQLAEIGLKELELIFEWVGFGLHSSVLNCRVLMVHP